MTWASNIAELLWRSAWIVIPLAVLAAAVCRWAPCRPATRHTLWLAVLTSFLAPLVAPLLPRPPLLPVLDAQRPIHQQERVENNERLASKPALAVPREGGVYFVAPAGRAPAGLLELRAGTPRPATDAADTAVPALAEPWVWRGRVGPARAVTDAGLHESDPDGAADQLALTQSDAVRPVVRPSDPPAGETGRPASSDSAWRTWVAALVGVRDALANLPTLPSSVWLAGIGGLLAVYAGGALGFRRRLRRSEPAPQSVSRMVVALARRFGLQRAPETVVVDEPISPMVWCGGRVRLVLPARLWSQLDEVGRRAILCHELAHLRRRDHWVRWLELAISVVFWWHPLVWWVRRRLHEESDLCCDAWVTWLMPRRRRAYAEALLAAREQLGAGRRLTPAVAVGVATSGAKRFARRITMVMTQSSRPGVSLAGIGLACGVALLGWIAAPAWCSPLPDDTDGPCKKVVIKGGTASACCPKPGEECAAQCKVIVLGAGEQEGGEPNVIIKKLGQADSGAAALAKVYAIAGGDDEDAVHHFTHQFSVTEGDLEKRLAKLEQAVQQLNQLLGAKSIDIEIPKPPKAPAPPAPPAPMIWHTPEGAKLEIGKLDELSSIALGVPRGSPEKGETVARQYKLPQGKLEALTALMARQDVPVLISPKEDCIEVYGTPRQHKIFKAFVDLIHPEGKKSAKKGEATGQRYKVIVDGTDLSELLESHGDVDVDAFLLGAEAGTHPKALKLYKDALGKLGDYRVVAPGIKVELKEAVEKQIAEQMREQAQEASEAAQAYRASMKEAEELRKAAAELQREAKRLQELAEQAEAKTR
jgi:beta-lactamase regulating signal transducer with metallopeptidase domain